MKAKDDVNKSIRLRFKIVLLAMILLTIRIPGYIAYRRTEEVLLGTAKTYYKWAIVGPTYLMQNEGIMERGG